VGDADNLVGLAESGEFSPYLGANLATDIGIDLVEDQHGGAVGGGEGCLEGKHDAGGFTAGGNLAERQEVLAGVGTKEEANCAVAEGVELSIDDLGTEVGLAKAEVAEEAADGSGKLERGGLAGLAEALGRTAETNLGGIGLGLELGDLSLSAFAASEARGEGLALGADGGGIGAVAAAEVEPSVHAALEAGWDTATAELAGSAGDIGADVFGFSSE
jgi:hypothetical protein